MVDVNLLPDELRGREAAERRRISKTPKVVEFTLTNPPRPSASPLEHGGSGMGRPVAPKPPPLPPAEGAPPPPPAPPLPQRPERLRLARAGGLFGAMARPPAPKPTPPERPAVPTSPAKPSAYHLDAAEVVRLAEAVKREVAAVQRRPQVAAVPAGRPQRHRWTFGQWLAALFARAPKPKPVVAAAPKPATAPPPPPKPPVRPVVVVVRQPPAPPVTQPPLARRRRSFWQWLSSLFARPPRPAKPLPQPKPTAPPPPPQPPVRPVVVTVTPLPAPPPAKPPVKPPLHPSRRRRSFWQWLSSLFASRPRPVRMPPPPKVAPSPKPAAPVVAVVPPPPPAKPPPPAPLPKPAPPPPKIPSPPTKPPPHPPKAVPPLERPVKTLAINLIPEEYARHPELNLSRKFLLYLAALGVSVFAVLTVSQFIGWYQYLIGNEIRDTEQRIKLLQAQIDNYRGKLAAAEQLQQDLGTMAELLARHRYWTRVFTALEEHTIDEVYFGSFTSASDGSLTLSAFGRDYESVARQLVAFREATDDIANVSILAAGALVDAETDQVRQVNFNVSLRLKPDLFWKPLSSPAP